MFHYNLCVWNTKRETACQEAFNENNYCQIVINDAIQEEREKEHKDTQEATQAVPYKFTDLLFRHERWKDNITQDEMKE